MPLTTLVYKTMKSLGLPRQLAFACWNEADWLSVLAAEGSEPTRGNTRLLGFWLVRQPRWLHLAPNVCADVQALLTSRKPNGRRAGAVATVIHETLHAYGVRNEAQTNCYAVQLVPVFGWALGLSPATSTYMGTLARTTCATAPRRATGTRGGAGRAAPGICSTAGTCEGGARFLQLDITPVLVRSA